MDNFEILKHNLFNSYSYITFTSFLTHLAKYSSHTSRSRNKDAYCYRQLTHNFELWDENFRVPTYFHIRIPKPFLSVCPYPEKNHPGVVNLSRTLLIDTWIERSLRLLQHKNSKIRFSFKKRSKLNFDLYFNLCRNAEITLAKSKSVLQ